MCIHVGAPALLGFVKINTLALWGHPKLPIDILEIEPPLIFQLRFAVTHQIVTPDGEVTHEGYGAHGPHDKAMKRSEGLVPGADLDAGPAT